MNALHTRAQRIAFGLRQVDEHGVSQADELDQQVAAWIQKHVNRERSRSKGTRRRKVQLADRKGKGGTFWMDEAPVECGRCENMTIAHEVCWYCQGPLCDDCWDGHGHCGHPEADAMNEIAREHHLDSAPGAEEGCDESEP